MENGDTIWEATPGEEMTPSARQARSFIEAVRAADPQAVRSPYVASHNTLAAVLGANISAERDGESIALQDVVVGRVRWDGVKMGPWAQE